MTRVSIGLDIGSTAVRAAEVAITGERRVLKRFAQVGLPSGSVVEGEVIDPGAVTAAIKRLWIEGEFSSRDVVLGVGSQRAIVRQVEMPVLSNADLRSALRYEVSDLLPIPMEQAVFDFAQMGTQSPSPDAPPVSRVLIVAAQREMVLSHIAPVKAAGLNVKAVDPTALSLLRAAPPSPGPEALDAIVCFGGDLMTITVRQDGLPRFVRTLAVGGSSMSTGVVDSLGIRMDQAEALKRAASTGRDDAAVRAAVKGRLEPVVEDIRGSLEFFLSQSGAGRFERVLLTGGGALTPGLEEALGAAVDTIVMPLTISCELDTITLGLNEAQIGEASRRWSTPVGLALWGTGTTYAPSLVPEEITGSKRQHDLAIAAGACFAALVVCLGGMSAAKAISIGRTNSAIATANATSAQLQQRINALANVTQVYDNLQSRHSMAQTALKGDIDWTNLLNRIAAALPSNVSITAITLNDAISTSSPGQAGSVGSISITGSTTAGNPAVANFVTSISGVKGLTSLWVSQISNPPPNSTNPNTTFTAVAQLTNDALSTRAANLPEMSK